MKRFRLSTLMLLIVIAALAAAVVTQARRAARREAELQAHVADLQARLPKYVRYVQVVSEVRGTQVKSTQGYTRLRRQPSDGRP